MSSPIESTPLPHSRPPVHRVLATGLRAALVSDPFGLLVVPLIFYFPNIVLEALQARFTHGLEIEILDQPLVAAVVAIGWAFALAGRLIGQAVVIRRTTDWLTGGGARSREEDFAILAPRFPVFIAVFLLFCLALLTGFVLFMLPGLLVLHLWGFAPQVAALEPAGVLGAFRRSRHVVLHQRRRWLAGTVLAVGALALVASGAALVWSGVSDGFGTDVPFGVYVLAFALVEFVAILFGASWTALYVDLDAGRRAREAAEPRVRMTAPEEEEAEDGVTRAG